ncbi:MAG: neutral/alkaline non-lysosomal ceramidase N-terminal domain-containing protein [Phycisphaerales bacterium]|nr:MAG: neutral/alkaline non-lysosomal ceramidase N-terminal domain-containing protein [Phycisphaerales bacterium]
MRTALTVTLLLTAVFSLCGCAPSVDITVTQPSPQSPLATGTPSAGAACVDITPPPGMPMGGYSLLANRGRGFRTRLKARLLYLNDGKGRSIVLVQTDLTAGSLLLHHKVAEAVAQETGLSPGDIAITASHSHSAPANFFENDFYNKHMSSGQWLELRFLEFAARRIAAGILQAHRSSRPARIATGRRDIYGYNRNRSIQAYLLNENAPDLNAKDPEAVFKAVNPALYMVRVDVADDGGSYKPLAAFSSFSVHATAITPPVQVYNADLFAYAQKDLEWTIQRRYQTPWPIVHALTAGTQGDMAPAVPDRGDSIFGHLPVNWKEAKELGRGIGREAIGLFEQLRDKLTDRITVNSAVRELNIRRNNVVDSIELCRDAVIGNSLVGGAYERRAPWVAAVPWLHGGNPMARRWFFKNGCQGSKRHLFFPLLQGLIEPKDSFPNTVMFQLIIINDTVIMPMPFEVTAESGRRMAEQVKSRFEQAGDETVRHVWVAGNANGYFGYTTTPEEYSRQNYEGGHTLYGRHSTPYLTAQLALLARDFKASARLQELQPQWKYTAKVNTFYPKARTALGRRLVLGQPRGVKARKENEEDYIALRWRDVGPDRIEFHEPLCRVEVHVDGRWTQMFNNGEPINDDGYDVEVRYLRDLDDGMAEYEVRWYNPLPGRTCRFVIEPRGGQPALTGPEFILNGSVDARGEEMILTLAPRG